MTIKGKTPPIHKIEERIVSAFIYTMEDYERYIKNEEDLRAIFYFHLRKGFMTSLRDGNLLDIFLSKPMVGKYNSTWKPDVTIFRNNRPLVILEMKNKSSKKKGEQDIEKLKFWANQGIAKKGFFIHIDKKEEEYHKRVLKWKNNFYRELNYNLTSNEGYYIKVQNGKTTKIKIVEDFDMPSGVGLSRFI